MAISFVGQATGTTSAVPPAHVAGDCLVAFAFRDGNANAPSLPGGVGWNDVASAGNANSCASRIAYKIAAGSSETTGTFTSATSLVILVFRGVSGVGVNGQNTGASTTVNYPALSLTDTSGNSWVVGFAGHRSVNTTLESAPGVMTNRATVVDATDEAAGHSTTTGVAAWTSQNVSVGGTSSGWSSRVIELIATKNATGTGTIAVTGTMTASGVEIEAKSGTAAIAATGALTGSGVKSAIGSASIAVTGTMTASGVEIEAKSGTASIAATGAVTGSGVKATTGSSMVAAIGALTGSGVKVTTGSSMVAATDAVTGSGLKASIGAGIVNIGAAIVGAGQKITIGGSQLLDHFSDIAGSGIKSAVASGVIGAVSTTIASGFKSAAGLMLLGVSALLSGSGQSAQAQFRFGTGQIIVYSSIASTRKRSLRVRIVALQIDITAASGQRRRTVRGSGKRG